MARLASSRTSRGIASSVLCVTYSASASVTDIQDSNYEDPTAARIPASHAQFTKRTAFANEEIAGGAAEREYSAVGAIRALPTASLPAARALPDLLSEVLHDHDARGSGRAVLVRREDHQEPPVGGYVIATIEGRRTLDVRSREQR